MQPTSSLFSGTPSGKSSFLSPSRHELPRCRSPSPMSASMIPPPIVQSTYASPPPAPAASVLFEAESPSHDRQAELEADLQYLLDAQAEGLVKGLEGGGIPDDATSTGSTTPPARSSSARRAVKPTPKKKRPGLRSARKGLYNTMRALSAVKADELQDLASSLQSTDARLAQIDGWQRKRAGLQQAAHDAKGDEEAAHVQTLREQAQVVEAEVRELERQLEDRRALHRKLLRRVADAENAMQARVASYTDSLRLLEGEVRRFLEVEAPAEEAENAGQDGGSVWQLAPRRRTLELAREHYATSREAGEAQQRAVEREKEALDAGAAMWRGVVGELGELERRMRADMRVQETGTGGERTGGAETRLRELLGHMDGLIDGLEEKAEEARNREWNLLIAAIGAEVDALRRGREILRGVLGVEDEQREEGAGELVDANSEGVGVDRNGDKEGDEEAELRGLDGSDETTTSRPLPHRPRDGNVSEDDHPDPELLFSQHDMDS